jgi:hypothetical protein
LEEESFKQVQETLEKVTSLTLTKYKQIGINKVNIPIVSMLEKEMLAVSNSYRGTK